MTASGINPVPLCGFVLISSLLLQSIFVAVTYIYFTNEHKQLMEAFTRSNIACLIGEDLGDFIQSADSDRNGQNDPCWEVKLQLQTLIKKIIFKHFKSEMSASNKEKVSETLPFAINEQQELRGQVTAAHVTGNNRKTQNTQNTLAGKFVGHKISSWKFHRQPSFLSNFEMEHGELIIKNSGFYYIYSQIYFRKQDYISSEENEGKQIVQQIYKVTRYPDPILLLKNAKTTCWSKDAEYELHSIYQGGVFKLNENDRLFVTVSDISLVDMDENASFFGAFLVA